MNTYKDILFDVEDSVATLTLNKPQSLNALTFDMMYEVQDVLGIIERDKSIRVLILTSAGRAFCSGQDLKNRPPEDNFVEGIMDCYFKAFNGLRTCRVPVITAINGIAAGGGFSLALVGDILIAAKSAKFIQVFSRIGLVPDLGSTYLIPQAIGRAAALKLMMTNDPISAEKALELGLISDCVEDEALMPTAGELAARLAKGPTSALTRTRQLVDETLGDAFEQQFRRELEAQEEMRVHHDGMEGVNAFLEKRAAQFTG